MPAMLRYLLANPADHSIPTGITSLTTSSALMVAGSGATDHMIPHTYAFISYTPVLNLNVYMGNQIRIPVKDRGTATISLNGQLISVRHVLHVPDLCSLLHSLCVHHHQPGCGFIGDSELGMHVHFPSFFLTVHTDNDCFL